MILNINIQIDTSNSAFEEDLKNEVETIITKHLKENYLFHSLNKSLRDSNGNTVGTFTTTFQKEVK